MSTEISYKSLPPHVLKATYKKRLDVLRSHQLKHNAEIEIDFLSVLKDKSKYLMFGPILLFISTLLSIFNKEQEGIIHFLFLTFSFFGIIVFIFSSYWLSNWFFAYSDIKKNNFSNYNISKLLDVPNWSSLSPVDLNNERWIAVKNICKSLNNATEIESIILDWEKGTKPIRIYDIRVLEETLIALGSLEHSKK